LYFYGDVLEVGEYLM